ncbi:CaiB/BaiF CoA transferase family protein [Rhizobium puerariae]|uniref:CaiB/BaiF CoA transferase family protein n=1 Tax=Rhizobium puerariae TaxID=1585791 RepID=A0ABV6AMG6_9HYPH
MDSESKPLSGVRVLDFGHTIMGPCAGMIMGDLGADVIKIEPIDGDPTRRLPGFAAGFFATFNRNKRSIALDLKSESGRQVLYRLAATADVVMENFGPGTIERLGCGWDELSKINPALIFLSMKGFLKGPYENRGALDEVVQMQSGLAYMTGPPGKPLRAGASVIDILGGMFGVIAVLGALLERQTTGRGKRIGSSLFESAAFLMAPHIAGGVASGEPMRPFPARKNAWGVYDVFDTRDGDQIFVGITSDAHWQRFCLNFGLTDLGSDPSLETNPKRCAERDRLIPILQALFASKSTEELLASCEAATIPYARVGHPDDLAHDPQLLAGGMLNVALSALGGGEKINLPGLPMEFGDQRTRTLVDRQPPGLSQHAAEILTEVGFSPEDIESLQKTGAVKLQS